MDGRPDPGAAAGGTSPGIAAWLSGHIDLAAIVLVVLLLFSVWVVWKAQKRDNFDFGNMLKDDNGKESGLRMSTLGAFAVSSWAIMHDCLAGTLTDNQFLYYIGFWSGAKVFEKMVDTFVERFNLGRKNGTSPAATPGS